MSDEGREKVKDEPLTDEEKQQYYRLVDFGAIPAEPDLEKEWAEQDVEEKTE